MDTRAPISIAEWKGMQSQNDHLRAELVDAGLLHLADEQSIRSLERIVHDWQQAMERAVLAYVEKDERIASLTTKQRDCEATCERLHAELTKSRDETQAMQDRASDLAASLCNARAQLDEQRDENARLRADLVAAKIEVEMRATNLRELSERIERIRSAAEDNARLRSEVAKLRADARDAADERTELTARIASLVTHGDEQINRIDKLENDDTGHRYTIKGTLAANVQMHDRILCLTADLDRVTRDAAFERQLLEDKVATRDVQLAVAEKALLQTTVDAAAECGRLRESLAVDEAEMASLREWLRDRTSERDDLLNSARDRNARHQRASFKHIAPVYICPTDDACIRLMRDSDKGRLTIFDEDLDSTGVYGVVEIDEQEGVNALFLALASYVDADTLRAAVAACAPPASGEENER